MLLSTFRTFQINTDMIKSICRLKKQFWRFSLKSHLLWFSKNIKINDIHLVIFIKNKLVAYNCLRIRNLYMKKKYIKYFYFDTLIVDREFRNKIFQKK